MILTFTISEFLELKTNKSEFIKVILSQNKGLKHSFG
jgi:hypothetical protein